MKSKNNKQYEKTFGHVESFLLQQIKQSVRIASGTNSKRVNCSLRQLHRVSKAILPFLFVNYPLVGSK